MTVELVNEIFAEIGMEVVGGLIGGAIVIGIVELVEWIRSR